MPQADNSDFADALRQAVDARGLSLDRVRAHLLSYGHDVSVATLSYWQTGRSIPVRRASLQALGALEVILQVPRGSLARNLPSQQGRRTLVETEPDKSWGPGASEADRISAEFGVPWMQGSVRISQDNHITIGADRLVSEHRVSDLIVAERDGFDRVLVAYYSDIPGVLCTVTAARGCRIGRVEIVPQETLTVAELILDQPLRAGEPFQFEHTVAYDTPVMMREWQRMVPRPLRDANIDVQFHPDCPRTGWKAMPGPRRGRALRPR